VSCIGPITSNNTISPNPPLRFTADRWLAADQVDGQTWVTLVPSGGGAGDDAVTAGDSAGRQCSKRYRVIVSVLVF